MQYSIEAVDQSSEASMVYFLKQHENYSLFLLGNFESYGSKLSESPYSGNFKLICYSGKVVGVFCLTKKGNLLIETTVQEPIFDIILASCREESIPLTGLVGNWDFCEPFWNFLKNRKVIQQEVFTSREVLYAVDLSTISYSNQHNVRLLNEADYMQWKPLRLEYLMEEGLPNDLTTDQLLKHFLDKVDKKIIWGFFQENSLLSIADLNAKALDLGQVGGVYTAPHFRKRGYSRSVMQQLLLDAKQLHALRKLIIFTGTREQNFPAQKLYESLGALRIGFFSLLFGK